jgi:hypothetical protein
MLISIGIFFLAFNFEALVTKFELLDFTLLSLSTSYWGFICLAFVRLREGQQRGMEGGKEEKERDREGRRVLTHICTRVCGTLSGTPPK